MNFFPDSTTFLSFGVLRITWYAIIILVGAVLAYFLCLKEIKKMGYDKEIAEDLFMGCLVFGVLTARLWFCVFYDLNYYLANPLEFFFIFEGGLAIQGGLLGGVLFGLYYAKKHKLNFFRFADAIVPNVLLAQAIGRWGNFINQEAFGRIVSPEFYSHFPKWFSDMMYIGGQYREPTFLYESVLNIIGFVLIVFVYKRFSKPKRGDMVYAYLLWYGAIRFWVEGLRTDSLMFMGLRMAQLTSIAFVIVGLLGMFGLFRKMFPQPKPILLFDLDGTLLDTEKAIIESYKYLFRTYRTEAEFTPAMQLEVLGPPLKQMFAVYFPDQDADRLVEEYREYNWKIHPDTVVPLEGAKDLLGHCQQQGYRMGIVSTKNAETVRYGLQICGIEEYFEVVVGQNDVTKGKPDPEGIFKACQQMNVGHDSCIYIGDTATDVEASKRAGVFSVGLLFNPKRAENLKNSNPNRVIEKLGEIKDILKEDVAWTSSMM